MYAPRSSSRGVAILALVALALASPPSRAEPPSGFVQVRTVPGVTIELDGRPEGTTAEGEGLVIRSVRPGVHRLRAALAGHVDQLRAITVEGGELVVVRLRPWLPVPDRAPSEAAAAAPTRVSAASLALDAPAMNAPATTAPATDAPAASASGPTGALWVETTAERATIDAKPLGWKKIALDGAPFVASSVPAGMHKLTFCNPEKCLDFRVLIPERDTLALIVDFGAPGVHDVSAPRKGSWARAQRECETRGTRADCERACNHELALALSPRSASCEVLEKGEAPRGEGAVRPPPPKVVPVASAQVEPPCVPNAGGRRGFLTLRSKTSAEVYLGETRLGTTPLTRVSVSAGCVELRLRVPGRTLEKRARVEIEPDQLAIYDVDL